MTDAGRFVVPAAHPSLPGHFPGRPIVPGVVVLDEAIALILRNSAAARLAGFAAVKFLAPVLPGDVVEVAHGADMGGRVSFECRMAGAVVVRGIARIVAR